MESLAGRGTQGEVRVIHHGETCRIVTETLIERSCSTLHSYAGGHIAPVSPQVSQGNANISDISHNIGGPDQHDKSACFTRE